MNLIKLVTAVAAAALVGCSTTPQDIDSAPIRESFVVNEKLEDVYYRLTTTMTSDSACGGRLAADIYPERGEFRIFYGANMPTLMGPVVTNHNFVHAKRQGDQTLVDLKKTSSMPISEGYTQRLINFIKTGKCE